MSLNSIGKFVSRFVTSFLLVSVGLAQTGVFAQSQLFKADLVTVNGNNIASTEVEIVLGEDAIELRRREEKLAFRSILYSTIVNTEYSYSNTPSIAEGTGGIVLLGLTGFPLFFNSKKRNWLTVHAGENSALFDFRSSNYRTLLLQLQQKKVVVTDLGDKNKKKKQQSMGDEGTKESKSPS